MSLETRHLQLLSHLLPLVSTKGWCDEALREACVQAGENFTELFSLYGRPIEEMVRIYSHYLDTQMLHASALENFQELRVREKISTLVMARLQAIAPFKQAGHKTLIYLSLPQCFLLAQRLQYKTVNKIWYAAGDTATDYNYYTKRFLLSGVYGATLLYWFQDHSPDSIQTRHFLERRIDQVMALHQLKMMFKCNIFKQS